MCEDARVGVWSGNFTRYFRYLIVISLLSDHLIMIIAVKADSVSFLVPDLINIFMVTYRLWKKHKRKNILG